MTPVIYRMAKDKGEELLILCLNPFLNILNDFRLKFLSDNFGIRCDYIYNYYCPSPVHKFVGYLFCNSNMWNQKGKEMFWGIFKSKFRKINGSYIREEFREVLLYILSAFFKKYLYAWSYEKIVKKFIFDERWAKKLYRELIPSALIFDSAIHSDVHIAGALISAAKQYRIPTIALPQGLLLFSDGRVPDVSHEKVIKTDIDYTVVPHEKEAYGNAMAGFNPNKLYVLGSARYCDEWKSILHSIMPTDELPVADGKVKVVYMERGADRHGKFKDAIKVTLEKIDRLDFVHLIIKPSTRSNRLHFDIDLKNGKCNFKANSVNLIRWADVVIGTVSSILVEVFVQRKILLYPKFFHEDRMWFDDLGACWTVHSCDELLDALIKLKDNPSRRQYEEKNVRIFLKEAVYCGKDNYDVLETYKSFILDKRIITINDRGDKWFQ